MTMRKTLLFTALVLTGCGGMDRESQFRAGLPTEAMVKVKSPDTKSQSLVTQADVHGQEKGKTSDFYQLTRGATVLVNGGTLAVLGLVNGVTKYQPTTLSEDTAVWGPHSEALARNAWRLTVKKTADHTYTYALAVKAKEAADSAFVDVLTGTQTAALDEAGEQVEGFGQGNFTLDWDKLQTVPEHDDNVGRLTVNYSRMDSKSAVTVTAKFLQVRDDKDSSKRKDVDYGYTSIPGQGGQFDFKQLEDSFKVSGSSKLEALTIKSRWMETGAGRSDVKLSGGDLVGEATLNECWGATFASSYLRYSWDPTQGYGTEGTDCAFTSAVYSSL